MHKLLLTACCCSAWGHGRHSGGRQQPGRHPLRIISDRGQNLRHNLDDPTGTPPPGVTVADTALTTPQPPKPRPE